MVGYVIDNPDITILVNGYKEFYFEYGTFPAGEPHVKMLEGLTFDHLYEVDEVEVIARIKDYRDMGHLKAVVDILKTYDVKLLDLIIPYFPGSRMDRDVPFTAGIYAEDFLKLGFENTGTFDPHSHVLHALGISSIPMNTFYQQLCEVDRYRVQYEALVAPDAGAQHRTEAALQTMRLKADGMSYQTPNAIVQCIKQRDPLTGKLGGFRVVSDVPSGRLLIIDDICDGGATFEFVYDELRKYTNDPIDLFVTHGLFTKGTDSLLNKFDRIYSTTSWFNKEELNNMSVIPITLFHYEED